MNPKATWLLSGTRALAISAVVLLLAGCPFIDGLLGPTDTDVTELEAPANVQAVADNATSEIVVAWDPVAEADSYRVQYKTDTDLAWSREEVSVTEFTLSVSAGVRYYFRVEAIRGSEYGPQSQQVSAIVDTASAAQTALDNADLTFTFSGDADWYLVTDVTHDGVDALRSGAIGHDQSSTLSTTVTVPTGETRELSFWWKVSSELDFDYLDFYIDSTLTAFQSGDQAWAEATFTLDAGTYALHWVYNKDVSDSSYDDAGWVDQITLTDPGTTTPDTGQTDVNLLTNPAAEDSGMTIGDIPGWDEVEGTEWQYRDNDPSPQEGLNYFFPGTASRAELAQTVDLSGFANAISVGQEFAFSGYINTWDGDIDTARIIVEYRDASGTVLNSYDTTARNVDTWTLVTDSRVAPTGTADARIRLIANRSAGSNADGYFDDLSFVAVGSGSSTPTYQLSATTTPSGGGTVTLDQSTGVYDEGTTATLTPTPASGYSFDSWTGADAADVSDNGDGTYSITMNADKTVEAVFAAATTNVVDPTRLGTRGGFGPSRYVVENWVSGDAPHVLYVNTDDASADDKKIGVKEWDTSSSSWINLDSAGSPYISGTLFTSAVDVTVDEVTGDLYVVAERYGADYSLLRYDGSSWTEAEVPSSYLNQDATAKIDSADSLAGLDYDNGVLYAAFYETYYDSLNVFTYNGTEWAELTVTSGTSVDSTYDSGTIGTAVYEGFDLIVGSDGIVYVAFEVDTSPRSLYVGMYDGTGWSAATQVCADFTDEVQFVEMNGTVYLVYQSTGDGALRIYNPQTGAEVFSQVLDERSVEAVAVGTSIYLHTDGIATEQGSLYKYDGSGLTTLWRGDTGFAEHSLSASTTKLFWTYAETWITYDDAHDYFITTVEYPIP